MSSSKSMVSINEGGKLQVDKAEVQKQSKKFMRANNKVAEIVEKQEEAAKELKHLYEQKKQLTAMIDADIKKLKIEQKQLRDRLLFQLGERKAQIETLKELGATIEDNETPKKIDSKIKAVVGV